MQDTESINSITGDHFGHHWGGSMHVQEATESWPFLLVVSQGVICHEDQNHLNGFNLIKIQYD